MQERKDTDIVREERPFALVKKEGDIIRKGLARVRATRMEGRARSGLRRNTMA